MTPMRTCLSVPNHKTSLVWFFPVAGVKHSGDRFPEEMLTETCSCSPGPVTNLLQKISIALPSTYMIHTAWGLGVETTCLRHTSAAWLSVSLRSKPPSELRVRSRCSNAKGVQLSGMVYIPGHAHLRPLSSGWLLRLIFR